MSKTKRAITIAMIEALLPNTTVWDSRVTGLGVRRQRSTAVAYVLYYRTKLGLQRMMTLGRHGAGLTLELAREQAQQHLAEVARGRDPGAVKAAWRAAPTVETLCDAYIADAKAGKIKKRGKAKKSSTIATDESRINLHIKPALGRLKVAAVTRHDIEKLRDKLDGHGVARVVGMLGAIFAYAVVKNMRVDNPVRGVDRPADGKRERRLSGEEYARLGAALRDAPASLASAVAASRFIAVTGWRRAEAISLTWDSVDLQTRTARLVDTKTGKSIRPLSHVACTILKRQSRDGEMVFPSAADADKTMGGYHKMWLRLAKMAAMPADITPHVLRHSFASEAFGLGMSELTIAFLLGHRKSSTTQGYIHADATLLRAADQVADQIAGLMGDAVLGGAVVDLGARRA